MSDLMYAPPKASLEKDETDSRGPEFYVVSLRGCRQNHVVSRRASIRAETVRNFVFGHNM
ncbi:hypothetical protein GSU75_04617 [Pseudomonas savastanoi pv. phaseolicola]|nr:hypothetical protein [Pseudomonas savastanoi pv. phaseolicola]